MNHYIPPIFFKDENIKSVVVFTFIFPFLLSIRMSEGRSSNKFSVSVAP